MLIKCRGRVGFIVELVRDFSMLFSFVWIESGQIGCLIVVGRIVELKNHRNCHSLLIQGKMISFVTFLVKVLLDLMTCLNENQII